MFERIKEMLVDNAIVRGITNIYKSAIARPLLTASLAASAIGLVAIHDQDNPITISEKIGAAVFPFAFTIAAPSLFKASIYSVNTAISCGEAVLFRAREVPAYYNQVVEKTASYMPKRAVVQ